MGRSNPIVEFISGLSFIEGLLVILILLGGWWIYKIHQRQLDDRQREINRLAKENREYRERFTRILERDPRTQFADRTRPKTEDDA